MTDDRAITLLRAADPELTAPVTRTRAESEALLERILREPAGGVGERPRPRARRRVVLGAVLAVAVLTIVALPASRLLGGLLGGDGAAVAATPELLTTAHAPRRAGAVEELRRIADRVEGLPDDVGSGPGVELTYRTWSLFTRIDGVDVRSRVVPQQITRVVDAEGLATITTRISDDDGDERETVTQVREDPVEELPSSREQVRLRLEERNPSGAAGRFNAVVETLLDQPAAPASRAAILRYLAATPGVATVGDVEDRLGRSGAGFTVESAASGLPTRYLLVIDPRDGTVLGYEEMLTRDAGKLEVPIPSVIQYVSWESAVYTG